MLNGVCNLIIFTSGLNTNYVCSLAFLLLITSFCKGQDKIYLGNDQLNGKIIEITSDKVKYKNPDNPGPIYSRARNNVKLLFNEKGGFLVIKKLDSVDVKQADKLINNFINPPILREDGLDKIFTLQNKQLNCSVLNEDETAFSISINDIELKIEKSSVAAIIYKDGKHKIIADFIEAVEVLNNFQLEKINLAGNKKNELLGKKALTPNPSIDAFANEKGSDKAGSDFSSDDRADKKNNAEQRKTTADSIGALNAINKKYNQLLSNAESLFRKGDLENAKKAYTLAVSLKPEEQEPQIKLELVNLRLSEIDNVNKLNYQFDSLIAIADSLSHKDWYTSVPNYKKALELKPSDYYAQKQINYLEKEIAKKENEERIQEEIRKKEELEQRYRNAVKRGDAAVKIKNYEEALSAYNEALSIHPENEYAQSRAKIMINQVNLLKTASPNKKD